jgi:small nuclear ribonucleoprotein B and B'
MYQYLNHRMRITIQDSRTLVGKFMAFDRHMNVVLGDCEEYRRIIPKGKKGVEKVQKRMLGMVILRGEIIVSMTVEAPPSVSDSRVSSLNKTVPIGQGQVKQSSRGIIPTTPLGPIPQFGTAPIQMMMPQSTNLQFGPPPMPGMKGTMPPMPFKK